MEDYYCQSNCWISACAKSAMAGPIFWNVKEENFGKHLEGLHADVLGLPEDERQDIVRRLHDLEPEKFVVSGNDLEVDLLHLTRSTLWVVDRRLALFRRKQIPHCRYPLAPLQLTDVEPPSTPPPVVSPLSSPAHASKGVSPLSSPLQPSKVLPASPVPPVLPASPVPPVLPASPVSLTLILRRVATSKGSPLYSCHFKDERMRRESQDGLEGGSQEKAPLPTKRKLFAAGSSKENVPAKKHRVPTTDARLKRMAGKKAPKVACPKKEDEKRFKEALLRARLQLEKRREKAKRTGGDGNM